jgi:hypothetical protein
MVSASRVPRFIGVFFITGVLIVSVFAIALILSLFPSRIIFVTNIVFSKVTLGLR